MTAFYNKNLKLHFGISFLTSFLFIAISQRNALGEATAKQTIGVSQQKESGIKSERLTVTGERRLMLVTPNTADLLDGQLGYSSYKAGGIASLPVLNGMADDRVATVVDGMRIGSGCPNHMNPIMSYVDPDTVAEARAIAGITPVSEGGDSTGGTIEIKRRPPRFSKTHKIVVSGHLRGDYRSNGGGTGASGSVTVANDWFSLRYTGSYAHSGDYRSGGNDKKVRSTNYLVYNHALTLGLRKKNHAFTLEAGQQDIPYEGFPNAYMDLVNNRSTFVNGHYSGVFDWGKLDARGFWQRVDHAMNRLSDKGGHSATSGMPMNTDARTAGYTLDATIPLTARDVLKVGSAFYHNGLNDWWPAVLDSKMMGPDPYHSINHGQRNRLGHYIAWNAQWSQRFSTEMGFRNDIVFMNTGNVAPYSWSSAMSRADQIAARAFNSSDRRRTDINFDATLTARWLASDTLTLEGGYARKTRSPNLYERYAWGTGTMASSMIGWFGDGNGYVGNLGLKPEVAHTVSMTFNWHDPQKRVWSISLQPYYTYTHNYINVMVLSSWGNAFRKLQFANHDAQSYGLNASGHVKLWKNIRYGEGELLGNFEWVRGQDLVTHTGLYHQMPANGTLTLQESFGKLSAWSSLTLVKSKQSIDRLRNEPTTPGYALLGLGARYKWRKFVVAGDISNLLNQKYYLPLGGWSLGDYRATKILSPLEGLGRSFNVSVTAYF